MKRQHPDHRGPDHCDYCTGMRTLRLPDHGIEIHTQARAEARHWWLDDPSRFALKVEEAFRSLSAHEHDQITVWHWTQRSYVRTHTLAHFGVATIRELEALSHA